jgi:N-sulfoglucosamine sulfohydrolase
MHRFVILSVLFCSLGSVAIADRPNILLAISDDQSWAHCSAYSSMMTQTPHFDRIAREGVLFNNAFCASPGCSPSRAALLTGRNTWQLEHAGTHASYFDPKYVTYPESLEKAGYFVGSTGKGWGPGNFKKLGRDVNPAGRSFETPSGKVGPGNYAGAFKHFLEERPEGKPFCFWFGSKDPHRSFKKGSGLEKGKKLEDAEVPEFLPDTPGVRSDLLDYAFEVERFDDDFGKILALLETTGELDNTLVIVTSDNGMAFPRAKANCYEYGIHMPLAIRWGGSIPASRTVDDLVGFTDLTATIYEATGVKPPKEFPIVGKSLLSLLRSEKSGWIEPERDAVFSARERHSSSRFHTLSYPQRCIRTRQFLYIRNFKPERWPAGPGQKFDSYQKMVANEAGAPHGGYHDIDACPTLTEMIERRSESKIAPLLELSVGLRPAEELFDVQKDPDCLLNLAKSPQFASVRRELSGRLHRYLHDTGDARVKGKGDVWETYPRVSSIRWFPTPDWAKENPDSVPEQPWLESRKK